MNILRASTLFILIVSSLVTSTGKTYAGIGTTVPVSAESGTSIAANLFPVTVELNNGNLFLTDPVVLFLDDRRIGMRVRFQAYDHRPAQGVAISEMGRALISGELDYDPATRQILLREPAIDKLEFDQDSAVTRRFFAELKAAWAAQVADPMRAEIPPHPYILPFKEHIQDISYDGKNINLKIVYE